MLITGGADIRHVAWVLSDARKAFAGSGLFLKFPGEMNGRVFF